MKTELTAIIMDGMDVVECIRREALNKNTVKRPLEDITQIEWQNTVELYIFGDDTAQLADGGLEAGCYLDSDVAEKVIVLGASNERITRIINRCGGRLRTLDLRFLDMQSLELPTRFDKLERLRLSPLERLREVVGLTSIGSLTELDLSFTDVGSVFDVAKLPTLRRLELAGNAALNRVEGLARLSDLEELDLSGTAVGEELDLSSFQKLKRLRLVDTGQLKRVFGLGENPNLEYLDLSCSGLKRIPDDVRKLKKLVRVDLSNLSLEDLPDWLPELKLDFTYCDDGINLRGTSVVGIDMSLFVPTTANQDFTANQEMIRQWFEDRKNAVAKPLNEVKVVFLGDGEAGKSHIIARLLQDGRRTDDFPGVSTPGITIQDKTYEIGDHSVKVHFWDFGGQEILHSMHRMFLTERTLYVVVVNVREGNQDDRARYWLHNLKSFANGAPVLLVLNKMDMNRNASVNEADLRKLYPGLTDIVKISALTCSREAFEEQFVDVLRQQIGNMDILEFLFPPAWNRLKEKLQNMTQNYISGDDFQTLCNESGVEGSETVRRDLLNWFSTLGVSFCYSGSINLEDYIVLQPEWITNAIYNVLFNKVETVNNGLVSHEAIYRMLSSKDTDNVRRTNTTTTYKPYEVDYVLQVFRKFRLSFWVDEKTEFMPMLCDANSPQTVWEYENDPEALEFRMHYAYLPNNVIHRLMIDRRRELDLHNVWLTGARFVYGDTGMSAVVKGEGNLLRIMVRTQNALFVPQLYLITLKSDLERINLDMGLSDIWTEVAYKADGIIEYFDYDDLLFAQQMGDTHIRSKLRRRRIPIADILKRSDRPAAENRERLIWDIAQTCEMLQSNRMIWAGSEDERNTYLRDLLYARGYLVMDQHLGGIHASGLDLDIRMEPDVPWAALEALNLHGSSASQLQYWNAHLDKLLDNYTPSGRAFLFLISYLSCTKDEFASHCNKYREHMRYYSPKNFSVLHMKELNLAERIYAPSCFMQAVECVYDCGGIPMTVYHYFVRIGE